MNKQEFEELLTVVFPNVMNVFVPAVFKARNNARLSKTEFKPSNQQSIYLNKTIVYSLDSIRLPN